MLSLCRWPLALALVSWLGATTVSRPAAAAEPTTAELNDAMNAATEALAAYKAADYETAANTGQRALAVLGPSAGWSGEGVEILVGITADSLLKLGRNAEADALIEQVRSSRAAAPSKAVEPPAEPAPVAMTPSNKAAQHMGAAMIAFVEGRYDPAVEEAEAGIAILEAEAPQASELASYRTLLAGLYQMRLEYERAEKLLVHNLDQADAAGDDGALHEALDALASMRVARGELAEGEVLHRRALDVAARIGTPQTRAQSLQGLAAIDVARGQPDPAIGRLEEALRLQESRFETGAMHLLSPLSALGNAYEEAGRFGEAEPTLARALAIAERTFGRSSPAGWNIRIEQGRLYRSMKRYDEAIALFEAVLREQESTLAPRSTSIGATLNHLAETLWAKGGTPTRTVNLAARAAVLQEHNIVQVIAAGTEPQKRAYLERYVSGTDRIISYHAHHVPDDADAARLSVDTILRRKGRVLDAVSGQQQAVRDRLTGDDKVAFDRLREARGQIASLVLRGPDEQLGAKDHRARIEGLEREVQTLEKKLSSVDAIALATELIELSAVQAALPEDAVLVEIAAYRPFDVHYENFASAFGEPHYVAYVIHADRPPALVTLGPTKAIDEAVTSLRRALANPRSDVRSLARRLDSMVMEKVRPHLDGREQVFISPDGQLNLVPFAALLDERDRYLVETLEINYLSSGRDLMRLKAATSRATSPAVLIGSPEFSTAGGGSSAGAGARRSADMSDQMFRPLPGTQAEVDAIAETIDDAVAYTGSAATEEVLEQLASPVVLHVATHGFFLADETSSIEDTRGVVYKKKTDDGWRPPPRGENPLIRSGLALTGANLRSASGGDGIFTALELAGLDLAGTELVVLSACETGVGEVRNGEGVYGLRRALVIAGARSQVMSLWQVDDEATRDLMVGYYRQLHRGIGRAAALRKVQRKLLRNKATRHPFYWAAFIPSGDWQPMEFAVSARDERRERRAGRTRNRRSLGGDWGGDLRDYWGDRFDNPMLFFIGGYSAPITDETHEGAAITSTQSFDLRVRGFFRPHVFVGADYSRQPWAAPDSPRNLGVAINHAELVLGFDLLALPYEMRVRPALHPYLGAGLAWGRQKQLAPVALPTDERERDRMSGWGLTFGTEGAIYIRLGGRVALALLGGVSKPIYRLRVDGDRAPYDKDFPRAWRWQFGVGIGGLPK